MAKAHKSVKFGSWKGKFNLPLIIFVLAVAAVGVHMLTPSNAATISYSQILDYQSAAQTNGVTQIQAQVPSLGIQTVNQVAPGAQLDYLVGGKTTIKRECYYVHVLPLKDGGTTATVEFTGPGAASTINLTYDPNQPYFQSVCVGSGTKPLKAYNVYNKSSGTGPAVLIYEDVVSM